MRSWWRGGARRGAEACGGSEASGEGFEGAAEGVGDGADSEVECFEDGLATGGEGAFEFAFLAAFSTAFLFACGEAIPILVKGTMIEWSASYPGELDWRRLPKVLGRY